MQLVGGATTDFNLILVVRSDNIFENTSYNTFGRIVRYIYYTKYTDLLGTISNNQINRCMYVPAYSLNPPKQLFLICAVTLKHSIPSYYNLRLVRSLCLFL